MTLDDRLRTVLDIAVSGDDDARAQYRQLVDLLGGGETASDGSLIASAFMRLNALSRRLPASARAAAIGEPAIRIRSAPLVAQLCRGDPEVAEAALRAAVLPDEDWIALLAALDPDLQDMARRRRLGPPQRAEREPGEDPAGQDIAALVARIERFRRTRERASEATPAEAVGSDAFARAIPLPPEADGPAGFDCRIDAAGRIAWASESPTMLVGLVLGTNERSAARIDATMSDAMRQRRPFRAGRVTVRAAPAISGEWHVDAAPRFDDLGRFAGYHARFARNDETAHESRADTIRQALHELRTPLNAMQGFAEIIQQQVLGPVPNQYRAAAAAIAGQAAQLLAEFEHVERLARLQGGQTETAEGDTAIGPLVEATIARLAPALAPRGAAIVARAIDPLALVAVPPDIAERLVWHTLSALAALAEEGESLSLLVAAEGDAATVSLALPLALAGRDRAALFARDAHARASASPATGILGGGFALRLAAAETIAAGGAFDCDGQTLTISLPLVTHERLARADAAA